MTPDRPRLVAVRFWAGVGIAFLAFQAYVFGAWIVSGKAKPTPDGPTPIPDWMEVCAHTMEVVGVLGAIGLIWWFVVRPWRRDGTPRLDGLVLLAILTLYWQDPLLNYSQNWATINTAFLNLGSWTTSVPGWVAPRGNLFPEAPLWSGAAYVYAIFVAVMLANAFMRRLQARHPRMGPIGLVGWCFALLATIDLLLEIGWMRLGMFTYAGSIEKLTLFHGHYYQFPIYEPIFNGAFWTGLAAVRHFTDDRGRTVAERGIDRVRASAPRKTLLRFLALSGVLNVVFLAIYTIPIQVLAMNAGAWPEDITRRSYLTDGLCGPGTTYACAGPDVPIPRPDSSHVNPAGRLAP